MQTVAGCIPLFLASNWCPYMCQKNSDLPEGGANRCFLYPGGAEAGGGEALERCQLIITLAVWHLFPLSGEAFDSYLGGGR